MSGSFLYIPNREALQERVATMTGEIYRKGCSGHIYSKTFTAEDNPLGKIFLYLTYDCPLRCYFCASKGGRKKAEDMSPSEFARITQDALDAGFREIILSGGEPFSYQHFEELLRLYEKMDFGNTLLVLRTSFGFPIADSFMDLACRVFDKITVSIDGDETNHDKIRGKGIYQQAVSNIKRALKRDCCEIGISATLSKSQYNGKEGKNLWELYHSLKLDHLKANAIKPIGEMEGKMTGDFYYVDCKRMGFSLPKFNQNCGLGHNFYVEPDGKAYPCYAVCGQGDLLGDLKSDSLIDILHGRKFLDLANHGVDDDPICKNCEVRYLCGGMCKAFGPVKEDCPIKKQLLESLKNSKNHLNDFHP